jgi:hypothetical protein
VILLTGCGVNQIEKGPSAYCSELVPLQFGDEREPNIKDGVCDKLDLSSFRRYKRGGFA